MPIGYFISAALFLLTTAKLRLFSQHSKQNSEAKATYSLKKVNWAARDILVPLQR